jgi:hypothetical protein
VGGACAAACEGLVGLAGERAAAAAAACGDVRRLTRGVLEVVD